MNKTGAESEKEKVCFFTLLLQMDSVSSDFNQKFACKLHIINIFDWLLYSDFYEHTYLPDREERERPKLEMKGLFAAPNCKLEFQVEATSMEFTTYYR